MSSPNRGTAREGGPNGGGGRSKPVELYLIYSVRAGAARQPLPTPKISRRRYAYFFRRPEREGSGIQG